MRTAASGTLEILAFERGPRTSWAACGLPYFVEGLIRSPQKLIARTPEQFAERGIDVRVRHAVTSIDTDNHTLAVRDLAADAEHTEAWDHLVIATGASGITPPLPGIDANGVIQLRTLDDGIAMDEAIKSGARKAVVVGAGYIGIEVAEALVARDLEVTVLELADQPMAATLGPEMAAIVSESMISAGIDLRLGTAVQGFATNADCDLTAALVSGDEIECDIAVLALGIRPNSHLAGDAGIELGEAGGIRVDDRMQTSAPNVWAAGDCVESLNRVTGQYGIYALGTHANKQGRVAGTNIAGGHTTFPGVIGTAITKFGDLEIGRTGITEAEGEEQGIRTAATTARSRTKAGYFPGSDPVTVRVIHSPDDGKILGAQIVGGEGSAKRIDVFATAIWSEMTVDDLAMVDMSYAPPFSPVWDPVVFAASMAAQGRS